MMAIVPTPTAGGAQGVQDTGVHVTVAICTYNRARLLEHTLEFLTRLTVPPSVEWELLVADNGSTDDTALVIRRYQSKLPVRSVYEPTKGLSVARNRCIDEARFDWILFTDDDVEMPADWLESFVSAIGSHPGAAVAGGPIAPWFPEPPDNLLADVFPELKRGFCGLDHRLPQGPLGAKQGVYGANFAVRKSAFGTMRFDTTLGVPHRLGEETDFVSRIHGQGGTVLWIPTMGVRHYVDPARMTLGYLRRYRAIQGATHVYTEGPSNGPTVFGAPRWLWRKWLESYASYAIYLAIGQRRKALVSIREHSLYHGMLCETRSVATSR